MNSDQPRVSPILILLVGMFGVSSGSILARLAQGEAMPSLAIAAWRLALASLILLPLTWARRRQELQQLKRADWRLALASGFMLALHFGSWISSLAYTSVASSTVLATTTPLWVGLASPLLLGERLTRPLRIGIFLAIVGSMLIGLADVVAVANGRFQFSLTAFTNQPNPLLGNGLALFAAFAATAYLMIGRRLRRNMSLLSYTAVVYASASLFLVTFTLIGGQGLFGYSPLAYLLTLLMAIFPQLIGHSSYNYALGYLTAAFVGIAVIAEPIGATILALLIFGEFPNGLTLLGSALLLAGILYASNPRRRRSAK